MGKMNIVWNRYFRDKKRFADFFNGVLHDGNQVIRAEDLKEVSEMYEEPMLTTPEGENEGERIERIRDIRMTMNTGEVYRLLALENQYMVNYAMPFRCMQYDTVEYSRQLDELRRNNEESDDYETAAERVGKVKKTDRLVPIYTVCLYHGEEVWDGPRSLKDMMDFGKDEDNTSKFFADYPMRLFCVNEQENFDEFHTDIKKVFRALKFQGNTRGFKEEIQNNSDYRNLDMDTWEVISVALNAPKLQKIGKAIIKEEKEKEKMDMCTALREIEAEAKAEGKAEGKAESVLELLSEKGEVSADLREKIINQKDMELLGRWLKKAAKAGNIEEFEKDM